MHFVLKTSTGSYVTHYNDELGTWFSKDCGNALGFTPPGHAYATIFTDYAALKTEEYNCVESIEEAIENGNLSLQPINLQLN